MSFVRATGMTGRIPADPSQMQVGQFGVLDEQNRLIGHLPGRVREWIERFDMGMEKSDPIDFDWEPGQEWEKTPTEILKDAQFWAGQARRLGDPAARAKADELFAEYRRVKL